jgi:hypothetical protein
MLSNEKDTLVKRQHGKKQEKREVQDFTLKKRRKRKFRGSESGTTSSPR